MTVLLDLAQELVLVDRRLVLRPIDGGHGDGAIGLGHHETSDAMFLIVFFAVV